MKTTGARFATLLAVGLLLALAGAADAEEWKIYLKGKVTPIVARYYAEESPWVFFQDDDSMYVFALGCDRVARVERAGSNIPAPACAVDKLPTTSPRILVNIMDLEAKRLEDGISRLREQTRAYAQAVIGTFAATGELFGERRTTTMDAERLRAQSLDAVAFLQSQIQDTLFDIRLTEQRVGALLDAAQSYPPRPRPRYFFAPR